MLLIKGLNGLKDIIKLSKYPLTIYPDREANTIELTPKYFYAFTRCEEVVLSNK